MPESHPRGRISRRQFLGGKSTPRLSFRAPDRPVLVVVFLRGGMDGLHVVPPLGDTRYRAERPTLALPDPGVRGGALDLDGYFGLHPTLALLRELYTDQRLAIVHAVESPDRTLSHFEAMQTLERGVSDGSAVASGWIARYLAFSSPADNAPMRALALSDVLPKSMQGGIGATAAGSLDELRLRLPSGWEGFRTALAALYAGDDPVSATGRETLRLLAALERLDPHTYQPAGGARYPESVFGQRLRQIAQLIKADLGLEVAEVDLEGWDSHVAQAALLEGLMQQLARGVHAFLTDLGETGRRVTLLAFSEFGRRVRENGGLGTDHGRGTAMFVAGGGVRGGRVYGTWPGLAKLDPNGNLRVTADYRDVLWEVLERRFGPQSLDGVFPSYQPRRLGLINV